MSPVLCEGCVLHNFCILFFVSVPEVVLIVVTFVFTGSKTCSRSLKRILFSTQQLALAKPKPHWQHSYLCTCQQSKHSGALCQSVTSTLLATTLQKWYVCLSTCGCNAAEYKSEKPVEFAVWFFTVRDLQNFSHRAISLQLLRFSQRYNWGFWCHGM